jgi:NADH-quinone oxidoreductase subunit L
VGALLEASATSGVVPATIDFGRWFTLGELQVRWSFTFDALSLPMAMLVLTVSTITQVYSYWYLSSDPGLVRFQAYLNLFTFSMLLLVFAENLVVLFLGWEGIGLCSYLLIGFWYTRPAARMAALKAVVVNRIGDAALLAAMGLLFSLSGSLDLAANAALLPAFAGVALPGLDGVTVLGLALALAGVALAAKSAQLGLHIWLLDAMEGPTPVSALIHAATLVTAGVYLMLRLTPLLGLAPGARSVLALVGAASALFGAAAACCQWDLKKQVAFSTMSQVGYMVAALGSGLPALGFYHLVMHGFFKALLFLSAGVLIHALAGEQDLRQMGGLGRRLPLTFSYFAIGSAALVGLPGTAGFASKERLLDALAAAPDATSSGVYAALWGALVCTAFYTVKSFVYIFGGSYRGPMSTAKAVAAPDFQELPQWVAFALAPLALLSLGGDALLAGWIPAMGGAPLQAALPELAPAATPAAGGFSAVAESLASPHRWLPLAAMALGVALFATSELLWPTICRRALLGSSWAATAVRETLRFAQRAATVDVVVTATAVAALGPMGRASKLLEKGLGEWCGPYGLATLLEAGSARLGLANTSRSAFGTVGLLLLAFLLLLLLLASGFGLGD